VHDDAVFARGPRDRDIRQAASRVSGEVHALVRRLDH
jgi:hypothetical protein